MVVVREQADTRALPGHVASFITFTEGAEMEGFVRLELNTAMVTGLL